MGIGRPPFYQDYKVLLQDDPQDNPYYSFVLDENNAWIDHHSMAVDGPVIHRDIDNPELLHLYLICLLYTSPSPRDATLSRMPSSA